MQKVISCSLSILNKANLVPFMLEYDFQPVVTGFIKIALIMMILMMTNGTIRS